MYVGGGSCLSCSVESVTGGPATGIVAGSMRDSLNDVGVGRSRASLQLRCVK